MVAVSAQLTFVRIDPDTELGQNGAVRRKIRGGILHDEDNYGAWESTRASNVEHTDKLYRRGRKNRT
jgi:hypothetical protein